MEEDQTAKYCQLGNDDYQKQKSCDLSIEARTDEPLHVDEVKTLKNILVSEQK